MESNGGGAERLLGQSREFLDFFWEIARPEQERRLAGTRGLLAHLQERKKDGDLLKYTLKRLVVGLGATREASRPGFSLALAQVLQGFEEISLLSALEEIKEKYSLGKVKKKLFRNALFGNFFGVLALFQSGRLAKEPKALAECVQLLQSLSEHHAHLKDLPRKTLADIVTEIPETVFEEVLFGVLEDELSAAFRTPGQLYLLLVGIQKFPRVLGPEKLKALLGTSAVVTEENIPRLVEVLKMAAKTERKDRALPTVGLDLMKVALQEGRFDLFWTDVVENGLLADHAGPCSYMCYRLLGSALPLLSLKQLQMVLQGEVMRHYGVHVVSTKLPNRFKFAPEMEVLVGSFLEGCSDPKKQLAVMVGFSTLTNHGYPVVPSFWRVARHLLPDALLNYISWIKGMFLAPDLDSCVEFATKRQNEKQNEKKAGAELTEHSVTRLRKWLIARLVGIVENPQIKREEEFVTGIARFCFFHAFFKTRKPTSAIPETETVPSGPLNEATRAATADSFFSLLQHLNTMPALGESAEAEEMRKKHLHGLAAGGEPWIYVTVQYANTLLSDKKHVEAVTPFSEEAQFAWDRMLQTVEALRRREQKTLTLKTTAFQHLLLLVGIHLFKSPAECVGLLNDLQNCTKRAFGEKPKKKTTVSAGGEEEEPEWVEVIVEVLLSLLAQSSALIRRVCRSVFALVCQHMTEAALRLILDVLDPQQDQDEESAVVVVEETQKAKKKPLPDEESDDGMSGESSAEEESSEEDDAPETDSETEGEADEAFRSMLTNVLQAGNALGGGDDSDEDFDDETMMSLDGNLSALFAEQRKRIQAKKDEKEKIRKEKILRREFKIKVLDLVEVFLAKQPENPLVFRVIEPLLSVIEQSMSSDSDKQEQDYLRKTADIFTNSLCRSKQYCRNVGPIREELHGQLESLVRRACKQRDSTVALYCFSASLYLCRVLKGNVAAPEATPKKKPKSEVSVAQHPPAGSLDLSRAATAYEEALSLFFSKRKSPLTGSMFLDLFERHPVMCKRLIPTVVKSITEGARQPQQAQACMLLQKALQMRDFKLSLSEQELEALMRDGTKQVTQTLKAVGEFKVKVDQEKVIRCLELLGCLIKMATKQGPAVDLTELPAVLRVLGEQPGFGKSTRLNDLYWHVMKLLGFARPAKEKAPPKPAADPDPTPKKQKKKGFLPATKIRKNRKKAVPAPSREEGAESGSKEAVAGRKKRKRKKNRGGGGGGSDGPEPGPPAKKSPVESKENKAGRGNILEKKRRLKKKKKGKNAGTPLGRKGPV